jgi:hypothetical protein
VLPTRARLAPVSVTTSERRIVVVPSEAKATIVI